MDKNTLTGLLLIGAIIIGFSVLNAPSDAEVEAARLRQDSIENVKLEEERRIANEASVEIEQAQISTGNEAQISPEENFQNANDSVQSSLARANYGSFYQAATGEAKTIQVETDKFIIDFNTKGGKLEKVNLKGFKTYSGDPLILMDSTSQFNLNFFTKSNNSIYTDDLVFKTDANDMSISGEQSEIIRFQLAAEDGNSYLEFVYTIQGNNYMIDFDINLIGLDQIVDARSGEMYMDWVLNAPNQEKGLKSQREATTIFYKYKDEDVDDLAATSDEKENFEASVKWVSLKQQFFNTTIVADNYFDKSKAFMETVTDEESTDYVKTLKTSLSIPVQGIPSEQFGMSIYFGPNNYNTLSQYDLEMQNIINLGWGIFGWVNRFAVIPVFTYLDSFDLSYGIIILILTILLKLVLMPITYKTYLSGAKMRVLKPEINELNEKYKDDAMKKQQAMMSLYKQTGVNPLSGCIPMLIQMPILIAMFRFFPSSIELRQESFLWADDLSSYDSIYNFPEGFSIPFYGDHVSLFTLLMAISLMFYTRMNSSMSMGAATEGAMASQMKIMTYMMPVMMLFFFNSYSSGLSYYYFLANVISMGQTLLIRKVFINEDSIRAKIESNKKRPQAKKKSGFQKRLEEMAKQKGAATPKKK